MTASRPDNAAIFHAARDISDADHRREYVREACGGDEARIAHIEALLAAADGPDSLPDRPAADITEATIDQPTETPGPAIGPYKLIEQIGEGGMGSVWMAQQTKLSTAEGLPTLAANRGMEPARLTKLVRGELDWIVLKALEKNRNRRCETANGFAMDVQRYLADEPVSAGPPTPRYRLRKFVRRNRARVTAAALVLLALVLGVVGTPLRLFEARRQEQQAAKRLAQVTKMNDILSSIFQDLNPENAQKEGKPLSAVLGERLDRATTEIEGEATGDPLAVARMQMILGVSQLGLGYPDRAIMLFTKARATFAAALGPDHLDTLKSMNNLANNYRVAGQHDRARMLHEETLALRREKRGPDHPDTLASMLNLAETYSAVGQKDRALKLFEEALALMRPKLGSDHPLTVKSLGAGGPKP